MPRYDELHVGCPWLCGTKSDRRCLRASRAVKCLVDPAFCYCSRCARNPLCLDPLGDVEWATWAFSWTWGDPTDAVSTVGKCLARCRSSVTIGFPESAWRLAQAGLESSGVLDSSGVRKVVLTGSVLVPGREVKDINVVLLVDSYERAIVDGVVARAPSFVRADGAFVSLDCRFAESLEMSAVSPCLDPSSQEVFYDPKWCPGVVLDSPLKGVPVSSPGLDELLASVRSSSGDGAAFEQHFTAECDPARYAAERKVAAERVGNPQVGVWRVDAAVVGTGLGDEWAGAWPLGKSGRCRWTAKRGSLAVRVGFECSQWVVYLEDGGRLVGKSGPLGRTSEPPPVGPYVVEAIEEQGMVVVTLG